MEATKPPVMKGPTNQEAINVGQLAAARGQDVAKLTYSFGMEIELVLKPIDQAFQAISDQGPFKQLQTNYTNLLAAQAEIVAQGAETGTFNDTEFLEHVAEFIASLLEAIMVDEDGLNIVYSQSKKASKLKHAGLYYRHWSVIRDRAISYRVDQGEWSVEIVSAVQYAWEDAWIRRLKALFNTLRQYFVVDIEVHDQDGILMRRGSTHVHIKPVPHEENRRIPADAILPIEEAKDTSTASDSEPEVDEEPPVAASDEEVSEPEEPVATLDDLRNSRLQSLWYIESTSNKLRFGVELAKFITYWDCCLHIMAPKVRRERTFCKLNEVESAPLYDTLVQLFDKPWADLFSRYDLVEKPFGDASARYLPYLSTILKQAAPETIARLVESVYNTTQILRQNGDNGIAALLRLMQDDNKNKAVAWSYEYLRQQFGHNDIGTLEHRRPPASINPNAAVQSVGLTLCFVHGALTSARGPTVYGAMASEKIKYALPKRDQLLDNTVATEGVPNTLLEFADAKLGEFKKWMLEAADAFDKVYPAVPFPGPLRRALSPLFVNQITEDKLGHRPLWGN